MNLLLFQNSDGDLFPVAEPPVHQDEATDTEDSFLGRVKSKVYHAYNQFRERFDYQERVCSYLRHPDHLVICHPASLPRETAQKKFRDYLKVRYSKHTRWLWIDCVLALLGSLLTPIPGPNIFFLYPAVRTMGHYLARKGARHALALHDLSFVREDLIDEIQRHLPELDSVVSAVHELEKRYQIEGLSEHLSDLCKHESRR